MVDYVGGVLLTFRALGTTYHLFDILAYRAAPLLLDEIGGCSECAGNLCRVRSIVAKADAARDALVAYR